MRPLTIGLALMLVTSLATSAWAACMADPAMTAKAQMACCKAGHEQCPMHGTPEDCCKTEGQKPTHVSVATHELVRTAISAPALTATIGPVSLVTVVVHVRPLPDFSGDVLKRPSAPTYLLTSALLI